MVAALPQPPFFSMPPASVGGQPPAGSARRRAQSRVLPSIGGGTAHLRACAVPPSDRSPMPAEPRSDDRAVSPAPPAGFLQIVMAVGASFFGVRKRGDHDAIARSVKPQHLIVAGVLGAALFVLALVVVVRIVIANA